MTLDGSAQRAETDREGWDDLRRRLIAFARRRAGALLRADDAEDLAQSALAAWLAGDRVKPESMAVFPFLCGVVSSLLSHRRRHEISTVEQREPVAEEDEPDHLEELRSAWRKILATLRFDQEARRLLDQLLAEYPERTILEVGAGLGWSGSKTHAVWRRIKGKARRRLGGAS